MIEYILLILIIIIIYYFNSKPKKCPKFKQSGLGKNLVLNEDKYILNEKTLNFLLRASSTHLFLSIY